MQIILTTTGALILAIAMAVIIMTIVWMRRVFRSWHICCGCLPSRVPAPALIFFPLNLTTLCCGLAGILKVKRKERTPDDEPDKKLRQIFATIQGKGIQTLVAGTVPVGEYLESQETLEAMDASIRLLKGDDAFGAIFFDTPRTDDLYTLLGEMKAFLTVEESSFEIHADRFSTVDSEAINGRLTRIKDIVWALDKDILENFGKITGLAGAASAAGIPPAALGKYRSINFLFNCLDRLEVRGRDSAGIEMIFPLADEAANHKIQDLLQKDNLYEDFQRRSSPGDLMNGSIQVDSGAKSSLSFIYKTSSVIGELGSNVSALRKTLSDDKVFQACAQYQTPWEAAIAHTRWASVGSITEENCHPLGSYTLAKGNSPQELPFYGTGSWSIDVVLNGDIDNYQTLRASLESDDDLIAPEITTDTKVIPLVIAGYLLQGDDLAEAFRKALNDFEGSHAIAMRSSIEPGKIFLALKGSGQAIYVGINPDGYIFASELYGLVEGTPFFIKMDGEKPSTEDRPDTNGQIYILDQDSSGGIDGIRASYYDGTPLLLTRSDIQRAEITTRDIDRRGYPHFFLKEITESTLSVKKTLRGKYRISPEDKVVFNLGEDILPERVRQALLQGQIRHITIIGHGTAAVAGAAIADSLESYLRDTAIKIEGKVASELSGFLPKEDLRDTLIIPITQSGTTTDTNRAVAMAVERGAFVIAIVNRRQSDITTKSDGVFYTSDGRDIEMSVASTKAFYSQIIAGHILALSFAQVLKTLSDEVIAGELRNLERAPQLMMRVIEKKEEIRQSVELLSKQKRYWAVVGSGPNKAAADEIRIKLSELCYKTISSDVIENKKHIDLSAEPLIIVCAAGNPEAVVGDIVKDVAIFKAHKAGVVVFTDEDEDRFNPIADAVIRLPKASHPLPVVLNTVAGHLWGYYAALSIDKDARFVREFRNQLRLALTDHGNKQVSFYEKIADRQFRKMVRDFSEQLNGKRATGALSVTNANTLSDLVLLLKYAVGKIPLEDFWHDFTEDDAVSPLDRLDICLGHAIDEMTRPIDAIRHQAKTVTVGTSRKEKLLEGMIFQILKELSFSPKSLTSKSILSLTKIQPAIAAINGYTLYAVNNLDMDGHPTDASTIVIVKREGVSLRMTSRAERSRTLMGTKKTMVSMGHVYVGKGKWDGAPIIIVPLLGDQLTVRNLLLLHVAFNEKLPLREKIAILGYKFNDIRNLINEYNLPWTDQYLEDKSVGCLLSEPAEVIAGLIKGTIEESPLEKTRKEPI
ncbi:MAG TPA: glutamine--fructose-6-phosphate aminotransferase [Syntrophus sp. (in: bacteria)]|nr:glutamine--fructose-6-phosphate aminotransferase [Syntrophus sp. (in: bacteria)]